METDDIKNFLDIFSGELENEEVELYKKIIDSSGIKKFKDPDEFFFSVLYNWKKFISGYIRSEISLDSNIEFIYKESQFIDRHFCNLFEKFEGMPCSADKSRTIINALESFYKTGKKIEFNYNGEYTYHLPDKILKTHDEIVEFYEVLKSLYYGNPDRYILVLSKLLKKQI